MNGKKQQKSTLQISRPHHWNPQQPRKMFEDEVVWPINSFGTGGYVYCILVCEYCGFDLNFRSLIKILRQILHTA